MVRRRVGRCTEPVPVRKDGVPLTACSMACAVSGATLEVLKMEVCVEYTRLGQTNLHVSRLAFGTWSFGGGARNARQIEQPAPAPELM